MSSSRRRLSGSPSGLTASPLEDENILSEILLRLPARPSSLPRAALVCKRWRSLLSDPYFLHRFRDHHRKPPLLGFFSHDKDFNIEFFSPLDPPDRIPAARFSLRLKEAGHCRIVGCRHGRVLVLNRTLLYFLVWDPVTGDQRREAFPLEFIRKINKHVMMNGAVLCAAGDQGHIHGRCHTSPFQVVMLGSSAEAIRTCVYSSKTGTWGNIVSLLWPQNISNICGICPSALAGDCIFWLLTGRSGYAIVEFDLCRQNLACIEIPSNVPNLDTCIHYDLLIAPADGGGLNLIVLSDFRAQVWKWNSGCNNGEWVLRNTTDLSNHLSLRSALYTIPPAIIGLVEDDNAMLLGTDVGIFVVHVESMQFKEFFTCSNRYNIHHPFTSFYSTECWIDNSG